MKEKKATRNLEERERDEPEVMNLCTEQERGQVWKNQLEGSRELERTFLVAGG